MTAPCGRGSECLLVCAASIFLVCCAPAPKPKADPTEEPWYTQTIEQLTSLNREAENDFQKGQREQAGALIEKGQPLMSRLLSVSHPTLGAAEAASDLDDLYGRMLLTNHHYGWARLFFQKNLARWKHWQPQTAETERRWKQADSGIAECDRHL
jgi:hypothetical protein